jgi:hypothetical protein
MGWAGDLRRELSVRGQQIAAMNGSLHALTAGEMPSVTRQCLGKGSPVYARRSEDSVAAREHRYHLAGVRRTANGS